MRPKKLSVLPNDFHSKKMKKFRYHINDIKELGKDKGFSLLSEKYFNNRQVLVWKCDKGHILKKPLKSLLKTNFYCKDCFLDKRLCLAKNIAQKRGGQCLSTSYKRSNLKLDFVCNFGHVFSISYDNLKQNHWCSECSSGLLERICKTVFEQIFEKKFVKIRPEWLRYNGQKLELDGYCGELNLAFEHQGRQHFTFIKKFHKTKKDFLNMQDRDLFKIERCKELGINLIVVPELISLTKIDNLFDLISDQCKNPSFIKNNTFSFESCFSDSKMKNLRSIASSKGGACLSKNYVNSKEKLVWRCAKGHAWEATPASITRGTWCRKCYLQRGENE